MPQKKKKKKKKTKKQKQSQTEEAIYDFFFPPLNRVDVSVRASQICQEKRKQKQQMLKTKNNNDFAKQKIQIRYTQRVGWQGKRKRKFSPFHRTRKAAYDRGRMVVALSFPRLFSSLFFFFYFFFNRRYIFPSTCGTRLNNSLRHVFDPSSQTPCVALPLSSKKKKKGHRALYIYLFISVYVNSFRPLTFCFLLAFLKLFLSVFPMETQQ